MHKKINITSRKAIFFSIFTILFLISLSIFFYLNKNKDIPKNPTAYPTPISTPSFSISKLQNGWQLYKSNDLGFEISYPGEVSIYESTTVDNSGNKYNSLSLSQDVPKDKNLCLESACFYFSITFFKEDSNKNEDFESGTFKYARFATSNIKLSGKNTLLSKKFTSRGDSQDGLFYKIPVTNGSYLISVDYTEFHTKQSDELAQKILQSFRIIE